jgi:hypothetical protein
MVFKDFLEQFPDNQTRTVYLSVYRETVIFYLKRAAFEYITRPIRAAAEKRNVRFEEDYTRLGHFFEPSGLSTNHSDNRRLSQVEVGKARLGRISA